MLDDAQPSSDLFVISCDPATLEIKVASRATDQETKLYHVSSEDAKTLAVQEARKRGIQSTTIKRAEMQYGDDKKGIPTTTLPNGKNAVMHPFLVVKFSDAKNNGSGYVGDSQVY